MHTLCNPIITIQRITAQSTYPLRSCLWRSRPRIQHKLWVKKRSRCYFIIVPERCSGGGRTHAPPAAPHSIPLIICCRPADPTANWFFNRRPACRQKLGEGVEGGARAHCVNGCARRGCATPEYAPNKYKKETGLVFFLHQEIRGELGCNTCPGMVMAVK